MTRVTIKDIAERAGVSKTAVSFAFNDPGRLSQRTLERILAVAEELGYHPDPLARSMTTRRIGTIGLLLPQPIPDILANTFFAEFVRGIGIACRDHGFALTLVPPLRGSLSQAILSVAVDGFIVLGLEPEREEVRLLRQRKLPMVTVDTDPMPGYSNVNVDDERGSRQAMAHVLAAGHRRIAILGIRSGKRRPPHGYRGTLKRRMRGYLAALGEAGLDLDSPEVTLTECAVSSQGGGAAFRRVWRTMDPRPTALVCMSDIIAIGAMDAARQMGLSLPEDLSVVGFDDLPQAAQLHPALTTVRQPMVEKGQRAGHHLVKAIEGENEVIHETLAVDLILRASVVPPP